MCQFNCLPDPYDDYPLPPGPRAMPHLTWATPVNIVELGASLEAYSAQLQQATTLRLCHRFRDGALSKLPQEILDTIIDTAYRMVKEETRFSWKKNYLCFQGRCTSAHHFKPYGPDSEEVWDVAYENLCDNRDEPIKKASDYTA